MQLDAFGTKCLRAICEILWSDFVTNTEVYSRTGQPTVLSLIRKRRLGLFGHIARMPQSSDVRQALLEHVSSSWKRPRGRPRTTWLGILDEDLAHMGMDLTGALLLAEHRAAWRQFISASLCYAPL